MQTKELELQTAIDRLSREVRDKGIAQGAQVWVRDVRAVLAALSSGGRGEAWRPDREAVGRAIYLGLYEHQGAVWDANDSKEVWYAVADRAISALPSSPSQGGSEDFSSLPPFALPDAWRPIESAPKDGTIIDLWAKGHGRKADMCWGTANGREGFPGWVDDLYGRGALYDERQFTHWTPLPAPPSEGG